LGIVLILGWASLAGYVFFMFYPSVVEKRMQKAAQIKSKKEDEI
jgi:hypothetical protein